MTQTDNTAARYWIDRLGLIRHPEGGWFKEIYRSPDLVNPAQLPSRFSSPRNACTAIYFLLSGTEVSHLHRIRSDELWHFYAGSPLIIHSIAPSGHHSETIVGCGTETGHSLFAAVTQGDWFGAELLKPDTYALTGCTVSPGFDFADFELGERAFLLEEFPHHRALIERLTITPAGR